MLKITMPRGDRRAITFPILNKDKSICTIDFDEIYITFKHNNYNTNYLFQKRLSAGQITKDNNNYYHFVIEPEDTNNLNQEKSYGFDIELYKQDLIKQTINGELYLDKEYTHVADEGD